MSEWEVEAKYLAARHRHVGRSRAKIHGLVIRNPALFHALDHTHSQNTQSPETANLIVQNILQLLYKYIHILVILSTDPHWVPCTVIVKISFTPSGPTHFAREVMLVSDYLAARRFAAWSSLAVSELQLSAATPLWLYHRAASLPSWIEFNCLRSAVVGKAARLSIYWHDAACRLVIPLREVVLAQLYKYHHQSGNAAS